MLGLMRATLVAGVPPKMTVAPLWNPLPAMVTVGRPAGRPAEGVTPLTAGRMVTFAVLVSLQPSRVTVMVSVVIPELPAVKLKVRVPKPEAIVPLATLQEYVAPAPASGTVAVPNAAALMVEGTVIVAFGFGLT